MSSRVMAAERHHFKENRSSLLCTFRRIEAALDRVRCRQMTAMRIIAIVRPSSVRSYAVRLKIGCPTNQTRSQVKVDRLQGLLVVLGRAPKTRCALVTTVNAIFSTTFQASRCFAGSSALLADRDIGEENRLSQNAAMFCSRTILPSYPKATLTRRVMYGRS